MATNPPPFAVEDGSDEDFFDKLIDDDEDVGFKVTTTAASGGPVLMDGNESDKADAFSNLCINKLDDNDEVNFDNGSDNGCDDGLGAKLETVAHHIHEGGAVEERGNPLASSSSFVFGDLVQHLEKSNEATEVLPDSTLGTDNKTTAVEGSFDVGMMIKSSDGSGAPGVKEVDWSAFRADSAQNDDGKGFGSYSDFFSEVEGDNTGDAFGNVVEDTFKSVAQDTLHGSSYVDNSNSYGQYNEGYYNDSVAAGQGSYTQDLNSSQYWESQYPGWKYDPSTGQWHQVDGFDAGESVQSNVDSNDRTSWGVADGQTELSYMQQAAQSVAGAVAEASTTENVTNWNQVAEVSGDIDGVPPSSHENSGYPPHMMFDPQYPEWYYDTIAQSWFTLESYNASAQSTAQGEVQMNNQTDYGSTEALARNSAVEAFNGNGQINSYESQGFSTQGLDNSWAGSVGSNNQQGSTMWTPEAVDNSKPTSIYNGNQTMGNQYGQNLSLSSHGNQQNSVQYGVKHSYYENLSQNQQSSVQYGVKNSYYDNLSQNRNDFPVPSQFVGGGNFGQPFGEVTTHQNDQKHFSNDFYSNQNPVTFPQQQSLNAHISHTPASGRSSAGRPPHALVNFGFGGKLIVMRNNSNDNMNFVSQSPVGGSISILNLAEVVSSSIETPSYGTSASNYFQALCRQPVPGPLAGGSVSTKELNKWIDERITNLKSADMNPGRSEVLILLLSLLKIACQYYGKLRSPYSTDAALKESDSPESAVARLFASARSDSRFSQYGSAAQCLQQLPSEAQMRATAAEVQKLLVSGRKQEALQFAQEGQLWGPALVLAAQLGDQFYAETVKHMALKQLVAGSPLRTLCLLIAGQPADVFSTDSSDVSSMTGAVPMSQQPVQFGAKGMLDEWEENLAVITANRTKDDELVLLHLGDCLYKERSDMMAAHICYLVAEASFEPYSDSARLCLIGADHWKFPRSYASPEAIQRTEIYEYSKTLGNSQFVLLPFQPYKFVYAHMLAEVGRLSEALKYCQAVLRSLKTGRSPEVETLRQLVSSLEERIKAHQQGGFSANLAPKEFIGKLLNLFDSTAHRVVGSLPPAAPTTSGAVHSKENNYQLVGSRVSSSQSTMAMSSLTPSQSMEPISEWAATSNRMVMHTRSVSEPNFGRSPEGQADGLKDATSGGVQDKASAGRTSRFGRFGFGSQLLQKTVGLVLKPRQGRQAKLGDTNKFYYDEKLKRWVEEGAEPPAPEAALPPPPTTSVFQNGTSEYNLKSAMRNEDSLNNGSPEFETPSAMDNSPGMPPLPPTTNQYSARGRMGVRSRYVDTFNKGGVGNATSSFLSPPVSSVKPASGPNTRFFVPAPVSHVEQPVDTPTISEHNGLSTTYEDPSTAPNNPSSFQSRAPPSTVNMPRYASMNSISNKGAGDNGSFSVHSRRTASWSGSLNDSFSPPPPAEGKPMQPSSFMPSDPSLRHSSKIGGSFEDELHEVEF
ncbi:Protein transport protein SEC16B homolog [Striga hermonthica]|uniref:Protein transport protein sec16 n=1 Tax=Striga hermonthica TaxID=68872 RepID=A0A9N7P2N5_STRHE|nr:Protein transport protein SEC16B homolog [Striga hermonthica]